MPKATNVWSTEGIEKCVSRSRAHDDKNERISCIPAVSIHSIYKYKIISINNSHRNAFVITSDFLNILNMSHLANATCFFREKITHGNMLPRRAHTTHSHQPAGSSGIESFTSASRVYRAMRPQTANSSCEHANRVPKGYRRAYSFINKKLIDKN